MDFTLSDEQKTLRETVRKFAQTELVDIADRAEQTATPVDHDVLKRFAEMGLLGVNLPEALGGVGLGHFEGCAGA